MCRTPKRNTGRKLLSKPILHDRAPYGITPLCSLVLPTPLPTVTKPSKASPQIPQLKSPPTDTERFGFNGPCGFLRGFWQSWVGESSVSGWYLANASPSTSVPSPTAPTSTVPSPSTLAINRSTDHEDTSAKEQKPARRPLACPLDDDTPSGADMLIARAAHATTPHQVPPRPLLDSILACPSR